MFRPQKKQNSIETRMVEVKSIFADSSGFQYRDESNIDDFLGSLELTALWGKDLETKTINRVVSCKTKRKLRGRPWR